MIKIASSLHASTFTTSSQIRSLFTICSVLIAAQNLLTTCPWFIPYFQVLTLLIALIVYRIWLIDRATFVGEKCKSRSPLRRVIRIIVESGMIYTTSILLCLVFLLTGSTAIYIAIRAVCLLFHSLMKRWCIYSRSPSPASLSIWLSFERTTPHWNTTRSTQVILSPNSLVCFFQQWVQKVFRKKDKIDTPVQGVFILTICIPNASNEMLNFGFVKSDWIVGI